MRIQGKAHGPAKQPIHGAMAVDRLSLIITWNCALLNVQRSRREGSQEKRQALHTLAGMADRGFVAGSHNYLIGKAGRPGTAKSGTVADLSYFKHRETSTRMTPARGCQSKAALSTHSVRSPHGMIGRFARSRPASLSASVTCPAVAHRAGRAAPVANPAVGPGDGRLRTHVGWKQVAPRFFAIISADSAKITMGSWPP